MGAVIRSCGLIIAGRARCSVIDEIASSRLIEYLCLSALPAPCPFIAAASYSVRVRSDLDIGLVRHALSFCLACQAPAADSMHLNPFDNSESRQARGRHGVLCSRAISASISSFQGSTWGATEQSVLRMYSPPGLPASRVSVARWMNCSPAYWPGPAAAVLWKVQGPPSRQLIWRKPKSSGKTFQV